MHQFEASNQDEIRTNCILGDLLCLVSSIYFVLFFIGHPSGRIIYTVHATIDSGGRVNQFYKFFPSFYGIWNPLCTMGTGIFSLFETVSVWYRAFILLQLFYIQIHQYCPNQLIERGKEGFNQQHILQYWFKEAKEENQTW